MRDHPVIRCMEQTGYPDGIEPEYPKCPMCGAEAEVFYKSADGEIVGCEECLHRVWAEEMEETYT